MSPDYPVWVAPTPNRDILLGDGISLWARWDGITAAAEIAGQHSGHTMSFTGSATGGFGSGGLEGGATYYAAIQFVDDAGNAGNLSTIEADTAGVAETQSTDTMLSFTISTTNAPARATGFYIYRSLANDPSVLYRVNGYPTSTGTLYAMNTTSVEDYDTDEDVANNTSIVAVNEDASATTQANRYGLPPSQFSTVVPYQDRMFAAVTVPYSQGMCEVTNGSTTVTGIQANFPTSGAYTSDWANNYHSDGTFGYLGAFSARYFQVVGDTAVYEIHFNTATTLTLGSSYAGTTSKHAKYIVYPEEPADLEVRYTYIDADPEPESWPSTYSFQCHAPGGRITALVLGRDYLYIAKQAKLYKFTFQLDPGIDGAINLELPHRGCENPRCWVLVEGAPFILDRQGIYTLGGGGEVVDLSEPIWPIFRDNLINWSASRWFHCSYDPERRTVKFFVAMNACYLPRQALCFNLSTQAWWIEEYPFGIGGSCQTTVNGRRRILLGGEAAKIILADDGTLDGPSETETATLRGTVTSATLFNINDTTASFPTGLANYPVSIVDGLGKGQTRLISSASGTQIIVQQPFLVKPDSTSTYQIGGFKWQWKGSALRYTARPSDTSRIATVNYQPTDNPAHCYFRRYENHNRLGHAQGSPSDAGVVYDHDGVQATAGDPDVRLNLYSKQSPLHDGTEKFTDEGSRRYEFSGNSATMGSYDHWITPELNGHASKDLIKIYTLSIDGGRQ